MLICICILWGGQWGFLNFVSLGQVAHYTSFSFAFVLATACLRYRFALHKIRSNPIIMLTHYVGSHPYKNKSTFKIESANLYLYFMGRTVGFEPTHIGTTIRGLNHLAMPAIIFYYLIVNFLKDCVSKIGTYISQGRVTTFAEALTTWRCPP